MPRGVVPGFGGRMRLNKWVCILGAPGFLGEGCASDKFSGEAMKLLCPLTSMGDLTEADRACNRGCNRLLRLPPW
jgi:hypothetical protein